MIMTTVLDGGIAASGVALLGTLWVRLLAVNKELKLTKFRSNDAGLSDLLLYSGVVDDGIIVNKDGSLMASWLYTAQDNASATDDERNLLAAQINKALARLGNGWMLHTDAVRREAPKYSDAKLSHFPDAVSAAIDEERRQYFEHAGTVYDGYFVITLTFLPPVLAQRKFVEMMFDDDAAKPDNNQHTRNLLGLFKREVETFESNIKAGLKLSRLGARKTQLEDGSIQTQDEFLRWLDFCVTGRNRPVVLPPNPMYLDALIGSVEMWPGVIPRIGKKFVQVVAIDGFPLQSVSGILNKLTEIPIEYRWSNRTIFLDQHAAISHLEKFQKKWKQKVRGFFEKVFNTNSGNINEDAVEMVSDASVAIKEVHSGNVSAGYFTACLILMDEDRSEVERCARMAEKSINSLGFGARIETINTLDAFFGSLPGHGVENVRRPLVNSLNVAHLIPSSSIWTGQDFAPCPFYPPLSPALMSCVTTGYAPFRLNLHVRDLGHTLIFGPPGSGKSTFLAILAAQFMRYRGMTIFAFDKGMSLYALASAVNGASQGKTGHHYEIGGEARGASQGIGFAPLQHLDTKADRAWAAEWIATVLRLNAVVVTPEDYNAIATAIVSLSKFPANERTLTAFSTVCQSKKIREPLAQYLCNGLMGHLLDATEDSISLSSFNVFEIEELMELSEKYALPVLLYLFRRIEKSLHGQPAVIILDEAWLMLAHPAFREKIREWLKVLRKANCIVIMATQNLSDADRSGIMDVMIETTASKIFLPNVFARNEDATIMYKKMGLNSRQINIIASATPKQDYYYVSELGRRLFSLAIGPLARCFVAVSDKEAIARIKSLKEQYGDNWYKVWIGQFNLSLSNYQTQSVEQDHQP